MTSDKCLGLGEGGGVSLLFCTENKNSLEKKKELTCLSTEVTFLVLLLT